MARSTLAEDTGVVYLHQLLPDDLTGGIPSIANGWDDFLQDASKHNDPGPHRPGLPALADTAGLAGALVPASAAPAQPVDVPPFGPALRRAARARLGLATRSGTPNQAAVDQYWQRHLLQLGYADRVLGRLLDRLHADRPLRPRRCSSSPPTTASASGPGRSAGRCRRRTCRTSPTCRCS